ncbi:MAG: lipocalin family protein [Rhodopila sp.]|nr:lipocalin family protein [Rhodopila sp.]
MRLGLISLGGLLLAAGLTACAPSAPMAVASNVDIGRFMGKWYVIANIPYFAEAGAVGSYDAYKLLPDGRIDTVFGYHDKDFSGPEKFASSVATVEPDSNNAKWQVSFFWPLSFSYRILYVDPDYQTAAIGYPNRSLGWVFSRSPTMDDAHYQGMLEHFRRQGYDITQFRRVPQWPEDIGKPGYQ